MASYLQESISDFYWYYSGKDVIDERGQHNFSKAINVAKQVFNTLTEYIQVNAYKQMDQQRMGLVWKTVNLLGQNAEILSNILITVCYKILHYFLKASQSPDTMPVSFFIHPTTLWCFYVVK